VGDSPGAAPFTPDAFHKELSSRQYLFPLSLNATATHDTKRGEDGRMRLNALTAVPDLWLQQSQEWHVMNAELFDGEEDTKAPQPNDEYFIYQSVLAGLPAGGKITEDFTNRLCDYIIKALREGKVTSNWAEPDVAYEEACTTFIRGILSAPAFVESLQNFYAHIAPLAYNYSLAQVLLKLTAPGVPDIYQGCELWDLSFVDPDNRRDVDYDLRKQYLAQLQQGTNTHNQLSLIAEHKDSGLAKLYLTWKALHLRKEHPALFTDGDYIPLTTNRPGNVLAYARRNRNEWAVVVTPLVAAPANEIADKDYVILAEGAPPKWKNVLTGEILSINHARLPLSVLQKFPAALLVSMH
jgi:(1->4)-alpha-D-glucan 1-alpha-D-glucosylmutase